MARLGLAGSLANTRISHCNGAQRVGEIGEIDFTTVRMSGPLNLPMAPERGSRNHRPDPNHQAMDSQTGLKQPTFFVSHRINGRLLKRTKPPPWRHHDLRPCTNKENSPPPPKELALEERISPLAILQPKIFGESACYSHQPGHLAFSSVSAVVCTCLGDQC